MFFTLRTRAVGALVIGLALLLAACGQPEAPRDASLVNFSLGLAEATADAQAIEAQGSPFDPSTGATGIETVQVTVRDADNAVVKFDYAGGVYTADTTGSTTFVTLSKATAVDGLTSASVALPAAGNPYTFESRAFASVTDPVIAYEEKASSVSDGGTVWINPVAVLGAASLAPRYPTTVLTPGSVLDVMLVVAANGHADIDGGDYLQVPLGDFEAVYDAPVGATILSQSNRGLRLQLDAQCSAPLNLSGEVSGLVDDAGDYVAGSVNMNGGSGLVLNCPPVNEGAASLDTEPPTVSVTSLNGSSGKVTGTADDNFGIGKVQVFDGPVLLASTDDAEAGGDVSLIGFLPGTTEFQTYLTTAPMGGITVVAFDASGNQSSTIETFNPLFVIVDDSAGPDGIGTEDSPLASIQAALEVVAEGGTIFVRDGIYAQPTGANQYIDVSKSVTITGESRDGTIIDNLGNAGAAYGMRIMASNVTVENLTVLGPDHSNTTGRGVFVQYDSGAGFVANDGFVLRNVTIDGARSHGVSFTGVRNALIENVSVSNTHGGEGIGLNLKSSADLVLRNVTTSGNDVGINIESSSASNNYPISNPSNISISGLTQDELLALSTEVYTPREASAINAAGFQYAVMGGACGPQYVYYAADLVSATSVATTVCQPGAVIRSVSPADITDLGAYYVQDGMSVQSAIDHASAGDVVNLASSADFTAEGPISLPAAKPFLKLVGNAANVDSLVVAANGATITDLAVVRNAADQLAGIEVRAQGVTLDTVSVTNQATFGAPSYGTLGYGILVPRGADASGLTVQGAVISNVTYGLFVDNADGSSTFSGALIDDVELSDITWKGMYFEALDDAVISDVTLDNVGWYGGWAGTSQVGIWGTGIDMNLKFGDYADILLDGVTATNTGWSFGIGTDATPALGIRGEDSDPNGAVIAVRARDDGTSYGSDPATLSGFVIDGLTVTDSLVGVRFGEPGKDNQHTGAVLRNSNISAPADVWSGPALPYAVVNASISDVDATVGNVLVGAIYDVNDSGSRGEVLLP